MHSVIMYLVPLSFPVISTRQVIASLCDKFHSLATAWKMVESLKAGYKPTTFGYYIAVSVDGML